ncbi:MAG: hypothetical protein K8I29_08410 [Alphaproteobacteria bacterium]|uniref:Uncharacterized protein n=1 Tax=Candidatus Nitrobium versatile TaxID=2884831 RepID=A0A953JBT0_9BACT|nr:hypothetical protein [Candidatus Nitrobium versatile]
MAQRTDSPNYRFSFPIRIEDHRRERKYRRKRITVQLPLFKGRPFMCERR